MPHTVTVGQVVRVYLPKGGYRVGVVERLHRDGTVTVVIKTATGGKRRVKVKQAHEVKQNPVKPIFSASERDYWAAIGAAAFARKHGDEKLADQWSAIAGVIRKSIGGVPEVEALAAIQKRRTHEVQRNPEPRLVPLTQSAFTFKSDHPAAAKRCVLCLELVGTQAVHASQDGFRHVTCNRELTMGRKLPGRKNPSSLEPGDVIAVSFPPRYRGDSTMRDRTYSVGVSTYKSKTSQSWLLDPPDGVRYGIGHITVDADGRVMVQTSQLVQVRDAVVRRVNPGGKKQGMRGTRDFDIVFHPGAHPMRTAAFVRQDKRLTSEDRKQAHARALADERAWRKMEFGKIPNPDPPRWVKTPAERKAWSDAEALAVKQGMADNYGYVTRIAQSLLGMKKRAKGSKRKGKMAAARKVRGGRLKGAAKAAHAGKVKRDSRGRIVEAR